MVSFQEDKYSMDLNTLMLTSWQENEKNPQAPKRMPNALLEPCYNCGGDQLIDDFLYPHQLRHNQALPPLARYCLECGITNLVIECPLNPKNKGRKLKMSLNLSYPLMVHHP